MNTVLKFTLTGIAAGLLSVSASAQDRNAYFGQTHQHTSWSFDAYVFGNTTTGPDEAYKCPGANHQAPGGL